MPLRDLLKKKEKPESEPPDHHHHHHPTAEPLSPPPQIIFMRSDTHTEEVLSFPDEPHTAIYDQPQPQPLRGDGASETESTPPRTHRFSRLTGGSRPRSGSAASNTSRTSETGSSSTTSKAKEQARPKRLSQRLGLRRAEGSAVVPGDLPAIGDDGGEDGGAVVDAWEERATMLARENERSRSRPATPVGLGRRGEGVGEEALPDVAGLRLGQGGKEGGIVASRRTDDNIQEAIRLHEAGELGQATKMFGRLADPKGENNALSQVLYALALRHGWGCTADPPKAMEYLSAAAANAASIETEALQAGRKGGGAAKGELVLAIFELANSFRHGWGVKKDPIAAKQYYETAANLGDTDAMNEVGWCYLEGFGCQKDKLKSAKYYRLAEAGGNKILGNSWIWKPKYDQPKS